MSSKFVLQPIMKKNKVIGYKEIALKSMKKYIVYYEAKNIEEDSNRCSHYFDEFGELAAACRHLEEVRMKGLYTNIQLLKNIVFKVEYSEAE